jgi:hypothetical protein
VHCGTSSTGCTSTARPGLVPSMRMRQSGALSSSRQSSPGVGGRSRSRSPSQTGRRPSSASSQSPSRGRPLEHAFGTHIVRSHSAPHGPPVIRGELGQHERAVQFASPPRKSNGGSSDRGGTSRGNVGHGSSSSTSSASPTATRTRSMSPGRPSTSSSPSRRVEQMKAASLMSNHATVSASPSKVNRSGHGKAHKVPSRAGLPSAVRNAIIRRSKFTAGGGYASEADRSASHWESRQEEMMRERTEVGQCTLNS